MLEAVIFDFDGVLVDTPTHYFRHMKKYLHELNKEISDDDIASLVGRTFDEKLDSINKKYGLGVERKHFVEKTSRKMMDELRGNISPEPALLDFLSELDENGVEAAVASSNVSKNIDFFLESMGIKNFFRAVISFDDVELPKPSPETYLAALAAISKRPETCVAIEDTSVGISSAKGAGLRVVAMPNSFTREGDLDEADLIVKGFKELNLTKIRGLLG